MGRFIERVWCSKRYLVVTRLAAFPADIEAFLSVRLNMCNVSGCRHRDGPVTVPADIKPLGGQTTLTYEL